MTDDPPEDEQPGSPGVGDDAPAGGPSGRLPIVAIAIVCYMLLGCMCLAVAAAILYRVTIGR